MSDWRAVLERKAALRARAGLSRQLRSRHPDEPVVDLAGNDYLGLANHPQVVAAAADALAGYGLGATGSRLVRGSTREHSELERELAGWLGAEAVLVYSSGYLANLGAIRGLVRRGTRLVCDAHAHASLLDGCRLSGAEVVTVPHLDPAAVAVALASAPDRPAIVVTESIFSVDGDLAPLAELHQITRRYGAVLLVDDAHGVGVIGPDGAGGVAGAGLAGEPDVVVTATLSKALGGAGGVVAGPAALVRHLVDTGRTFIYDTAPPPAVAAGVRAALRLAAGPEGSARRAELHQRARAVSGKLAAAGLAVSRPDAGVVSVLAADAHAAVAWAAACADRGVAVGCFRPPTTPDSRSRLRLTINVGIDRDAFTGGVDAVVSSAP